MGGRGRGGRGGRRRAEGRGLRGRLSWGGVAHEPHSDHPGPADYHDCQATRGNGREAAKVNRDLKKKKEEAEEEQEEEKEEQEQEGEEQGKSNGGGNSRAGKFLV